MDFARKLLITGSALYVSVLAINNIELNQTNVKLQNELKLERNISTELAHGYNKQSKMLIEKDDGIKELNEQLKKKSDEIHRLEKQLEKARKDNESPMRQLDMTITAYIAFCSEGCTGKTRTGYNVSNTIEYKGMRIVATDPKVIPLYSIIEIELESGKKVKAISLDTGGVIDGDIVDFLVEDYQTAIEFGRQQATVKVLREGK